MDRNAGKSSRRIIATCGLLAAGAVLVYLARSGVPGIAAAPENPSWQPTGLSGETVHALAAGRTRAQLLFAGTGSGVFQRTGDTWRRVLTSSAVWSIALLTDDRELVAGTDDGHVYVSADRGRHWLSRLVSRQGVYAVTAAPGNGRRILAGGGGGLYLSRDGGHRWTRTLRLHQSAGTAFTWLPGHPRTLFAGTVPAGPTGERRVFVSRDAGTTWHPFGRGMAANGGIMSLTTVQNTLFAGTMGHAVWEAPFESPAWRHAGSGMPATGDHGAALIALPDRTVYVGTLGQGVFRTSDAGRRWTNVSTGLPRSSGLAVVLSLAATHHGRQLYAGTLSGVYRLSGPSWTVTGTRR